VKYKVSQREWNRQDLYQVVAFATGFRATHGAIISFKPRADLEPPALTIGDVSIRSVAWLADPAMQAADAEKRFLADFANWVNSIPGLKSSTAA
jgi:hypothetical protein